MHKAAFTADAVNGFEDVLDPPRMVKDVAYWLNRFAGEEQGKGAVCTIMASVEESTVGVRETQLLAQVRREGQRGYGESYGTHVIKYFSLYSVYVQCESFAKLGYGESYGGPGQWLRALAL
jgi:hypothetical protein